MGQKKKLGKTRLDKFYHLAKEQGYRSRAAFKLIQLNRKYDFLSSSRSLLDLCAAPGGWLQVAVKNMPVGSLVIGVDLVPIRPVRGAKTFVGDITTAETRALLRREAGGTLFDSVVHDGAPNVGGAWATEAYSQSALALEALRLATDTLAPGGTFVTKVFRSKDYTALLYAMRQLFKRVEATKPAASRSTSAEIFVVCQGYKAPARIDPQLLDPRVLFRDVAEPAGPAGPDALLRLKHKQHRHREGYEDGLSTLHKAMPAADFIAARDCMAPLGQFTTIDLKAEPATSEGMEAVVPGDVDLAAWVRDHALTSKEITLLCQDLQVLGKSEFKQLVAWHRKLHAELTKAASERAELEKKAGGETGSGAESSSEDEEDALAREMQDLKSRQLREAKRERRKRRETRQKTRLRTAQLAATEGIGEEVGPESLFSLASIKSSSAMGVVGEAGVPDAGLLEDSGDEDEGGEASDDEDLDPDEAARRYEAEQDEDMERMYEEYQQRRRTRSTGGVKKRRRREGMDGELSDEELDERADAGPDPAWSSDDDDTATPGGGLVVSLDGARTGVPATGAAAAAHWFGQDAFEDADLAVGSGDDDAPAHVAAVGRRPREASATFDASGAAGPRSLPEPSDADPDATPVEPAPRRGKQQQRGAGAGARVGEANGFEEVPVKDSDSDSDSDMDNELELLDDDAKATMMALAKKMLRRKVKDDIVEAAYNRYAFHDTGLPSWFEDDERKHMRPMAQVSAEEHQAAKDTLRAVGARPMKKVAEAKARKAKRLATRLAAARQKAEAIAASEDGSAGAKVREIEKLYRQARGRGKGKKKPSRSDEYKKKGPHLDARMRKDKRGADRAAARKKAGRGGKRRR